MPSLIKPNLGSRPNHSRLGSPALGVVKLNCDASKIPNVDIIGFGCVIRDNNGVWQYGCAGTIPSSSVLGGVVSQTLESGACFNSTTANRVSDALAKHAINNGVPYAEWLMPWDDLRALANLDIIP
ncbi:hypothetical protein PIB30_049842 [Stylosanthes scabra]|uniref:RNase H type-1 domain-containing protein n=1 Tax=Stylosanthes scabra TaxID=79078 RepID=A0ABU6YEV6_9FABA|nr:hypothetical protein [Stylosanthes scabra]